MSSRRGVLGLLGLAVGAAPNMPAQATGPLMPLYGGDTAHAAPMLSAPDSPHPEDYKKWCDRLNEVQGAARRQHYAQRHQAQMLGGLHPHVYPARSWAPWFKTQVSMRKMQEAEDAFDSWTVKLKKEIFGKWWNW